MPQVRFTGRFSWVVRKQPRVTRVYTSGVHTVTRVCAEAAKAAGKAVDVPPVYVAPVPEIAPRRKRRGKADHASG